MEGGIEIHFPQEELETAGIIEEACRRSIPLIHDMWGLTVPGRCRVYVMTSLIRFIFSSAPWYARIYLAILLPLWFSRVRKLWRFVGGWTQRYRHSPAIGVKPPRLIEQSDKSIGEMIFIREPDPNRKIQHITCHEITHAATAHLRLPLWINEGIAMVTVDRFFRSATVRKDTLQSLDHPGSKRSVGKYRNIPKMKQKDLAYHYVRGYWITRYLADAYSELLRELLKKKQRHRSIEKQIASAVGIPHSIFWHDIDRIVFEHFARESQTGEQQTGAERRSAPSAEP
jgi:hypothetical protein